MGSLRTACRMLACLTLTLQAAPGFAQTLRAAFATPALPSDPVHLFATCTGRLSALREFQWLTGDAGSDATGAIRERLIGVAEAATPPDRGTEAMSWRVQSKAAFAALLSASVFSPDPAARAAAAAQATRMAEDCRALVLSP